MRLAAFLAACIVGGSVSLTTFAQTPQPAAAPATRPATQPAAVLPAVPEGLTGNQLAIQAQSAFNRGEYAKALPNMRINAVEPGFTKTDLNGNTGHQTVEEGAEIIVRMAQVGPDGPTGGYFDAEGALPW